MKLKKIFTTAIVTALTISMVGCSSSSNSTEGKDEEKVLRYGVSASPGNMDPTNLADIFSYEMVRQSYNGLTDRKENGEVIPGLAESWEVKDGGKTYTFKLREGVKFHSGNELKASDVKFTFEHDLDPSRDSSSGTYLSNIVGAQDIIDRKTKELAGFKILNDYEFTIEFTQPEVYFPEYCSVESLYIVEQAIVEGSDDNWWETQSAGTGPYKLTEFKVDEATKFEAFDDYYNGAPAIDELEFIVVAEDQTAMNMYNNDELDIIAAPWEELENIEKDEKLSKQLVEHPLADMTYLGMSQDLYEPFKDEKVRQAISLVISQDDLAQKVLQDTVYPLYGVIPVDFSIYNKNISKSENNAEKARKLLEEAGYTKENPLPEITLYYLGMDEDCAVYIADQLKKELNWEVKLESPDRPALLSDLLDRKLSFYIFGSTASYGDARSILYTSFYSDAKRNFSGYDNKEYDKLIDEAATLESSEERGKLYLEAEQVILDDFGFVPMYTSKEYLLVKPYVKDLKISGLGMDILDTVKIEK